MSSCPSQLRSSIIEPVGGHGGIGPYDFNLARGLSNNGLNVALYTSDETLPPTHSAFTFHPIYRGIFGTDPSWLRGLRYLRGTVLALIGSVMGRRRICHFHFFLVGPLEFINVLLARLLLRRVVITAHDVEAFSGSPDTPGLPSLVYGMAHAVIAHNRVSYEELVCKIKLPPNKVHIIPAGNHLDSIIARPTVGEARRQLGLSDHSPVLLFFGHIKRMKGLDILIESLPAILAQHPETILVIAGRPLKMGFEEYQERINELGIGPRCLIHARFIPDHDLPLYFQASDLICLPYRKIYQSDVVLMAMSYGKAVVTSDIPGMTAMIEDGRTGFLFRSGDSEDLARVVNLAIERPALREKAAIGGLNLMKKHYGWDAIGKTMANLYRSL